MKKLGIYFHVPFCRKKCDYCSFYSIPYENVQVERYTDAVIRNIKKESPLMRNFNADSVYFGGGTPSLLGNDHFRRIIAALRDNIEIDTDAEITMECNPVDIESSFFQEKKELSFNRFSIGVQTLDRDAYGFLGRKGGFADDRFFKILHENTHLNISLDYISALPGQTVKNVTDELEKMIFTGARHFSIYLLSVENGTPLFSRFAVSEEYDVHQAEVYYAVKDFLESKGYCHYEISNFCLKGFESRHNLKYWNFDDYIGFGPSAHSFLNGKRWSYADSVNDYCSGDFRMITDRRTLHDAKCELLMTAMRLRCGLNEARYIEFFDSSIEDDACETIAHMIADGSIERISHDGTFLRIPDSKIIIADTIIEELCSGIK